MCAYNCPLSIKPTLWFYPPQLSLMCLNTPTHQWHPAAGGVWSPSSPLSTSSALNFPPGPTLYPHPGSDPGPQDSEVTLFLGNQMPFGPGHWVAPGPCPHPWPPAWAPWRSPAACNAVLVDRQCGLTLSDAETPLLGNPAQASSKPGREGQCQVQDQASKPCRGQGSGLSPGQGRCQAEQEPHSQGPGTVAHLCSHPITQVLLAALHVHFEDPRVNEPHQIV